MDKGKRIKAHKGTRRKLNERRGERTRNKETGNRSKDKGTREELVGGRGETGKGKMGRRGDAVTWG
jgi:hypothetical protein